MKRSAPWPRAAKLTVALLAIAAVIAIAALGGGSSGRSPAAGPGTGDPAGPTVASTARAPATAAPTTAATVRTTTSAPAPPSTHRTEPTRPATTARPAPPSGRGLAATLAALPVATPNWSITYKRTADFGPAWKDVDHNGCDTRNDILRRDLVDITLRADTHGCVVIGGVLHDPYTGRDITFVKARASEVQIDHLVPLAAAWSLGASGWTQEQREAFANDPTELLAVSGSQNESKGDRLADAWRPPNPGDWCDYAQRIIRVHAKYVLPVTAPERAALGALLDRCP